MQKYIVKRRHVIVTDNCQHYHPTTHAQTHRLTPALIHIRDGTHSCTTTAHQYSCARNRCLAHQSPRFLINRNEVGYARNVIHIQKMSRLFVVVRESHTVFIAFVGCVNNKFIFISLNGCVVNCSRIKTFSNPKKKQKKNNTQNKL